MDNLDLQSKRRDIHAFGLKIFNEIINTPKEIRDDDKERTGIMILVREVNSRNLIFVKILEPSEATNYFVVEKAVRSETLGQAASQNSENEEEFKFAGSITIKLDNGKKYQVSVSGLKAHEDVVVAILVMAKVFDVTSYDVIENIKEFGGELPSFLIDKKNFLNKIMREAFV